MKYNLFSLMFLFSVLVFSRFATAEFDSGPPPPPPPCMSCVGSGSSCCPYYCSDIGPGYQCYTNDPACTNGNQISNTLYYPNYSNCSGSADGVSTDGGVTYVLASDCETACSGGGSPPPGCSSCHLGICGCGSYCSDSGTPPYGCYDSIDCSGSLNGNYFYWPNHCSGPADAVSTDGGLTYLLTDCISSCDGDGGGDGAPEMPRILRGLLYALPILIVGGLVGYRTRKKWRKT